MKLLLIRHGRPVDRGSFASSGHGDDLRPLSADGRRAMRKISSNLAAISGKVETLVSSTFARAVETAALLARELHDVDPTELAALSPPADISGVIRFLSRQPADGTIALIGHEPSLGRLASRLLAGKGTFIRLKHGGACLLHFAGKPATGKGKLVWLLTPKQLRKLK